MKIIGGLCLSLLLVAGLFAQNHSGFVNAGPPTVRTFPSAVYPAGSSALPGVQRTVGSVVYPGGGTAQIGVPGIRLYNPAFNNGKPGSYYGGGQHRNNGGVVTTYAYPVAVPVYVGGYDASYGSYYDQSAPAAAPLQTVPQQPNVIVIYPQGPPAPAQPAMVVPPQAPQGPDMSGQAAPAQDNEVATHYLIAFKDHSIYSAVAYWVEGDTLHYFTTGNTHNQVSLSLVDRDLTMRLNKESGVDIKLPAPKQ